MKIVLLSPATLPLACRLQASGMGAAVAAHCANADAVHYLGTGLDMLGFAAETSAREAGATFSVEPAIHIGSWGDRWIDAALYRRGDVVIAYARREAAELVRLGVSPERIHRIHCRCDHGESGDAEAFRSQHAIRGPLVHFLGRKTVGKGLWRLLDVWPAARREFRPLAPGPRHLPRIPRRLRGRCPHPRRAPRMTMSPCRMEGAR